jgi:hypothetical protein
MSAYAIRQCKEPAVCAHLFVVSGGEIAAKIFVMLSPPARVGVLRELNI